MNSALVEKIQAIERKHIQRDDAERSTGEVFSTGWADVDRALGGGLPVGGLQEWFGLAPASANALQDQKPWRPPLCVMIHFASRVLDCGEPGQWVVWIGRRCFPYPAALRRKAGTGQVFLQRSLFIAPRNPTDRLWAIDLALRSPAVGGVIADGSGFDMAATRRVQLVARNHSAQAFLVRPPCEQADLSAAHSRWLVRNTAAGNDKTGSTNPAWTMELLRCKGVHWAAAVNTWRLEWNRAECTLDLCTPVADPAGTAQATSTNTNGNKRFERLLA